MNVAERLLSWSRIPLVGAPCYALLKIIGVEFPRCVPFGNNLSLPHGAVGLVVHESSRIGKNVRLFQGVTLGRADQYLADSHGGGVIIEDDVIICAGAKILFKSGQVLRIGKGSIVGANAVVLGDIGTNEIWAGVPARLLRTR